MTTTPYKKTCSNCQFYESCYSKLGRGWGRCHRYAPHPPHSTDWMWPAVNFDDFCGEFEPADEVKEMVEHTVLPDVTPEEMNEATKKLARIFSNVFQSLKE